MLGVSTGVCERWMDCIAFVISLFRHQFSLVFSFESRRRKGLHLYLSGLYSSPVDELSTIVSESC